MGNVTISTASVAEGTCPPWIIALWPELVALLSGNLNGALNVFNYGNSVPAPADQGKPWIRLNSDGTPDKVYVFSGGSWIAPHPDFTGKVVMWEGNIANIATLDGGEVAAITATTGPMWEQVTEMNARSPIGPGTLPSGTILSVGTQGGEENHQLIVAEMPRHAHVLKCDTKLNVGSEVRRARNNDATSTDADVATDFAGNDVAHNNMSPYSGIYFLRKTNRRYYRI